MSINFYSLFQDDSYWNYSFEPTFCVIALWLGGSIVLTISAITFRVCVQHTGQVQLGDSARNYFSVVQFWIWLAAVSPRGKKVRTVASPAVRSVNKSRDARNCVLNEPEYAICVLFTTRLYYRTLGIILCAVIWQIRHNYNRLDDGHCDVTCHRNMSLPVPWWQPMKMP